MSINKIYLCIPLFMSACTASVPKNVNDVCSIFVEKDDWYPEVKHSFAKWGVPIHVTMAIMHQESRFVADAKPPRPWLLGVIPWFRSSSSYGYAQAQDAAWQDYLDAQGYWGDDRDNFSYASDFIGWYCSVSHKRLGISKWDTQNLYLAYHEGHGGYSRKTYLKKPWLLKVAKKVDRKASQFRGQLATCKEELERTNSFFW